MLYKRSVSWREQKPNLYSDVFRSVTLTSYSLLSITCIRDKVGHSRVCVTTIVFNVIWDPLQLQMELQLLQCVCVCVCVCVFSVGSHTLCIVFFFRLCHIPRLYVGFFIYSLTVLLSPPVLLLLLLAVCVRARVCCVCCDVTSLIVFSMCFPHSTGDL